MAWAWDSHPEMLLGHVNDSQSVLMDIAAENDSSVDVAEQAAPVPHDHYCCCGHVHVVAITVSMPTFEHCSAVKSEQVYRSSLLNYIPSLPSKPPRI